MPAIMIIMNAVFMAGVVAAIVGLCAWGIVTDRPFATYLTERAKTRPQRSPERRRVPGGASGSRGSGRRPIDVGA
jgi:hypothetical protein